MVAFEILSWYGTLLAIAGAYLLWASVLDTGHRHYTAVRRRLFPDAPLPPHEPAVVLDRPSYSLSMTPLHERLPEDDNSLVKLTIQPRPLHNNEADVTIREITVGARRRLSGAECEAPGFRHPSLAPGGGVIDLPAFDIPVDMLHGMTEQNYQCEILTWARFDDPAGNRWEVVCDPTTGRQSLRLIAADAVA